MFLFHILPFQFRLHLVFALFSFGHSKIFYQIKIQIIKSNAVPLVSGMDTWCRQQHHQHMLYLIWNSNEQLSSSHLIGWNFLQSNGTILKTCLIPLSSNMVFYENFVLDFLELLRENFRWYISLFHFQFLNRLWSLYTLHQGSTTLEDFLSRYRDFPEKACATVLNLRISKVS